MPLPEHLQIRTEVRAFTYEIDQLRQSDIAQAAGMYGVAAELSAVCRPDATPEEILAQPVRDRLQDLSDYVQDHRQERHRLAIEQGARTRSYSLHPHEELVKVVDAVAADAYLAYARVSGVTPDIARQIPGSCYPLSYIMQRELRKQGVDTRRMWWTQVINNHHFLRTIIPNAEPVNIDLGWQMYLPQNTNYLEHPHVLISPVGVVRELLWQHRISEEKSVVWRNAKFADDATTGHEWMSDPVLQEVFRHDPWIPPLADG